MTNATDDHFWTVAEIAALLRVSKMTVYRIAERREFPGAFRVGSGFRIPGSGLQAYMRNNQIGDNHNGGTQ
jgi:excisionase family DNA binding protein